MSPWLAALDLAQYTPNFEAQDIDMSVLPTLTDADLRELGVSSMGNRKRILSAISALVNESSPHEPQRRLLTVLFCDLVGLPALTARLDLEDLRQVVGRYHQRAASVIQRFGGFAAQFMEDGVMAFFGYPVAHEDDAERAVRAGLALVEDLADRELGVGVRLAVRVGIATGDVVVGEVGESGAARASAAIGETPNLAARLQAIGEPGMVVVAPSTRRLTAGAFEYRELGSHRFKGFGEPVAVSQVLGISDAVSRFEAQHEHSLAALVGRDGEIESLRELWRKTSAGSGQVVLICADPGVGKSRIVAALEHELPVDRRRMLRHFCSPYHAESPLHPIVANLTRACATLPGEDPSARISRLAELFDLGGASSAQDLGLLCELLSWEAGDRVEPFPGSPQQKKSRLFDILYAQLRRSASVEPQLLVFEDAHWADATSLELLDGLVKQVATRATMLVITHRPEFEPPWPDGRSVLRLTLNRLDRQAGAQIVARVAGGRALPPELLEDILARTDGVPLYLEELTSAVLESGILREASVGLELRGPLSTMAVPMSLNASLLARLDRLAPVKAIAQIGAAIGREFGYALLSEVARWPVAQLDDALARLVASGLLIERAQSSGARTFIFKHALVQEVTYSTLLRARRQPLHALIATALETRFPEAVASQPEVLARHLAEAGLDDRAVLAYRQAGQLALSRSAEVEATAHLRHALALLQSLPEGEARDRLELPLQTLHGMALSIARGYADTLTIAAFERARALMHRVGTIVGANSIFNGLYIYYSNRGDTAQCVEIAFEFLEIAEQAGDPLALLSANRMIASTYNMMGQYRRGRPYCERAMALAAIEVEARQNMRLIEDPGVEAMRSLAIMHWHAGEVEKALGVERDVLLYATGIDHANTLGSVLGLVICTSAFRRRDFEAMDTMSNRLIQHGQSNGLPMWEWLGRAYRGWLLIHQARPERGIPELELAMSKFERTQAQAVKVMHLGMLAEGYLALGEFHRAHELFDQSIALAELCGANYYTAELWRLRARTWLLSGAPGARMQGESALARAMAIARDQGSVMYELHAACDLLRWQNDAGLEGSAHEARIDPMALARAAGVDRMGMAQVRKLMG
ncbi:MAG: AAA family ATPase [Burkholderiaceae bacterium]|nr:AAA family ATPase [Burkholderiaceae bacterium]